MQNPISRWLASVRSLTISPINAKDPALARLFDGGPVAAGVPVNEWNALTYSAVWSAVGQISSTIASLPLKLYRRTPDGGKEPFAGHKLYELLHDNPNPEMTSFIFREILQAHLLTWGNAYSEIERDGFGRPAALWPIPPDRVEPIRDGADRLVYRVKGDRLGDILIPAADMLHVPGLGFDGIKGYGLIQMARESLGLGLAAERFGGTFFGNGSTFGGFLSHPAKISVEARQNIENSLNKHAGPTKAHRILLLQENMTFIERKGIPPNDAQFLETRTFQVQEVARWLRISPYKLGDLSRATFSNIEHQAIEYYTDTIRPWLVRWEQEINRKLVAPLERRQQFAEFVIEGALRGDVQSRYAAYAVGRQWGWLSANDIRSTENMNPLPSGQGDIYLVPMNMVPASRIDEIIDKQVAPPPAPVAPPPVAGDGPSEEQTNSLKRAIELLEAEIPSLRHECDEARMDAAVANASLATVEGGSAELRAIVAAAEARVLETEQARNAAQVALALAQDQRDREAARAAAVEAEAEALKQERAGLSVALDAAVLGQTQADQARDAADAARAQWEAHTADAQAVASEARADSESARTALETRESKLQEARAEVVELAAVVQAKEDQLRMKDVAFDERGAASIAELEQMQAERDAKVAEVEALTASLGDLRELLEAAEAARLAADERVRAEAEARAAADAQAADEQESRLEWSLLAQKEELRAQQAEAALAERDTIAAQHAEKLAAAAARETEQAQASREASQKQALAESQLSGVAEERDAALAAVREAEARLSAGRGAMVSAHRALYQDAMTRLLEREIDRIIGARSSANKLRTVMGPFYDRHIDVVTKDLVPLVRVHLSFLRKADDSEAMAADLAEQHVALSKADLAEVYEASPDDFPTQLSQMIQRWRSKRTSDLAEYLMRQEIERG